MTVDEDVRFIKEDLLPEMVHERCFCESGSREFVEFDGAEVWPQPLESHHRPMDFALYRATLKVLFSGEPELFHVLVKLLPGEAAPGLAFDAFLNEEILWNKGTLQLGKGFLPRFYLADLGRYGRPVVVVDDLERIGYERVVGRGLDGEEAEKVMQMIGEFHGKGLEMKETRYPVYREFEAKFQEISFEATGEKGIRERLDGYIGKLKTASGGQIPEYLANLVDDDLYLRGKTSSNREPSTICNGRVLRENLWFKRSPAGGAIEDVKILDWQRVRCGSNCLDLTAALLECESADRADDLLDSYVRAVQKESPTATRENLVAGLREPGLSYALIVTAIEDRSDVRVPDVSRLG